MGLRVARLGLCVSTESDGGFSPGYVLLSFQILTPSSRQLPLTTPLELRSRLPCVQTRENPPYKGGCPKIGLDRRGGMNQNTPNPGVALRWPHPCSIPIEWGIRGRPPNEPSTVIERSGVVLDTLRSGCRQGTEMGSAAILARGIMINSRGERRTKALEGTEDFQQTPSNIRRRNQRVQTTVTTNPHMRSVEFSHVALEDPLATGLASD